MKKLIEELEALEAECIKREQTILAVKVTSLIRLAKSSVEVPGGLVEALKDWWFRTGKWCHNNEETAQFEKILTHYTPSADKGLINELSELCDTQERDETEDIVRRYDRFWIATIRSHISHYAPKEQAPKQQDGLSKEYPWLEDGPNWKDLIMLHRETQAAYHAAKGKAADSPECEDFRVKVKRSAREWLRIYNPLIYPQSAKPVEPLAGCNMCGSKKVFIRGKYPKEPDREICPCCLVEKLEDMVSNFNITASCERPDTGEDKGGGV